MGDQPFFLQSSPPPALPSFPAIPSSIPPPPASVVAAAAMNSTDMMPPDGLMTSGRIGSFGYGIGISVGILILITTITLASYYCTRNGQPPQTMNVQRLHRPAVSNMPPIPDLEIGLDEATLMSYPKLLYSKAKLRNQDTTASCCSICLADYKDTDMLRLLPDCGHLFHLKCVDPWLRLHPTCPVCRTSPFPTPLPTPLSEVVPLRETARV